MPELLNQVREADSILRDLLRDGGGEGKGEGEGEGEEEGPSSTSEGLLSEFLSGLGKRAESSEGDSREGVGERSAVLEDVVRGQEEAQGSEGGLGSAFEEAIKSMEEEASR